jgi:hypothetical protein
MLIDIRQATNRAAKHQWAWKRSCSMLRWRSLVARRLLKAHTKDQVAFAPSESQLSPNAGPEADELARLAYQYWLERGSPTVTAEEDWFRAVEEITLRQQRLAQERGNG